MTTQRPDDVPYQLGIDVGLLMTAKAGRSWTETRPPLSSGLPATQGVDVAHREPSRTSTGAAWRRVHAAITGLAA